MKQGSTPGAFFVRSLYSLLFYIATPFVLLRVFWRGRKEPTYRQNLAERFGFVKPSSDHPVWVHAVSAGEMIATVPLIEALLKNGHPVVVTNMTPTGRERCEALVGDKVENFYVPYDLPDAMSRFLKQIRPKALIIIDTELWPNMLNQSAAAGVKTFLVNGRLSEKSARGYGNISWLSKPMLASLTMAFIQTESQADRFVDLGLPNDRSMVTGSIKFDAKFPADMHDKVKLLKQQFAGRQIFLAASTHPGEETIILDAFRGLKDQTDTTEGADLNASRLLVIAPRHSHRADAVEKLIERSGHTLVRRSEGQLPGPDIQVFMLDTMGELIYFYGIADIAFVGGSLVEGIGGHNPMEPAGLGVPILMGPHRRNVTDIAEQFELEGALKTVADVDELRLAWQQLETDQTLHKQMSTAATQVMTRNRGALMRVIETIGHYV